MKIRALLVLSAMCFVVSPVLADDVDDAVAVLKSDDFTAKQEACQRLGSLGGPKALKALIAAFQDDSSAIQEDAAEAIGAIGGAQAETAMLAELRGDSPVRGSAAAKALGAMKSRKAVLPLIAVLKKGFLWRENAAKSLALIGDLRAVDGLVAAIPASQSDQNDIAGRAAIAEALGELGEPRAAKGLVLLLGDENSTVRDAAGNALENVGWVAKTDREKMLVSLQMHDWDTLSSFGEKAIPVLILGLDSDTTSESARKMLVSFGDKAVNPLVSAIKQNNPQSPKTAAIEEALVEIGPASFSPLMALFKSSEWNDRATATIALGQMKDERAINAIAKFLVTEASSESTFIALDALRNMGDPGKEKLYAMLGGKDEAARLWVAFALGRMGEEVLPRVLEIGKASKDRDVRGACAWVLEMADTDEMQAASAELLGADPAQAAKDYEKLLKEGRAKDTWLLIAALERSGSTEIGTRFLNSGSRKLDDAARLWAAANGYRVTSSPWGF
jgi:HEAT repeat protein